MGREVRMVPADWQHPKDERTGSYKPLHPGHRYEPTKRDWLKELKKRGLQRTLEWCGNPPNREDYMPNWPKKERTHLMMYEDTSEGTPISPAFKTPEDLARWLANNKASAFGDMTATYEQWLSTCKRGWAPGMVSDSQGLRSGVALDV